jgi:negative elongation factor A
MQKSIEAANKIKSSNSSAFPARVRTMPKKMSDTTPLKGLPSRPLQSSGFRAPRVSLPNRQNAKKEGGVKLLDINEQPIGYSATKKRKRQQENEEKKAAEEAGVGGQQNHQTQNAHVKSENIAPQNNPTPDYAANLAGASIHNNVVAPPAYVPPTPQAPQQAPPPPAYAPVQQTAVTLPIATHQASLPGNPVTVALPTVPHPGVSIGTRIVQLPTQPIPQVIENLNIFYHNYYLYLPFKRVNLK